MPCGGGYPLFSSVPGAVWRLAFVRNKTDSRPGVGLERLEEAYGDNIGRPAAERTGAAAAAVAAEEGSLEVGQTCCSMFFDAQMSR